MECVKCGKKSSYAKRRRRQMRCPNCREPFAFEPERGDLLVDREMADAIATVARPRGRRFHARELWQEVERQRKRALPDDGWTPRSSRLAPAVVFMLLAGVVYLQRPTWDIVVALCVWSCLTPLVVVLPLFFQPLREAFGVWGAVTILCLIVSAVLSKILGFTLEPQHVFVPGSALTAIYFVVTASGRPTIDGDLGPHIDEDEKPELAYEDFLASYLRRWKRAHGRIDGLVENERIPEVSKKERVVEPSAKSIPGTSDGRSNVVRRWVEGCSVARTDDGVILSAVVQGQRLPLGGFAVAALAFVAPFALFSFLAEIVGVWFLVFGFVFSGLVALSSFSGAGEEPQYAQFGRAYRELVRGLGRKRFHLAVGFFLALLTGFMWLWRGVGEWVVLPLGFLVTAMLTLTLIQAFMLCEKRVRVTFDGKEVEVLQGLGKIEWQRRFRAAQVKDLRLIGTNEGSEPAIQCPHILVSADRKLKLGALMDDARRRWILDALQTYLSTHREAR